MRMTRAADELALADFAKKAAQAFAKEPRMCTFGSVTPGSLFALRWGAGDDCVLVVKLDEDFEPVNFQQLIKEVQ